MVRTVKVDEMKDIIQDLRTLAVVVGVSSRGHRARQLVERIARELGPINGNLNMVHVGNEILYREVGDDELPLATVTAATMDLLSRIQFGDSGPGCAARLEELAAELEMMTQVKLPGDGNDGDIDATWQAKAIGYIYDHRDWTTAQVAEAVGKSKSQLYRDPDVGVALKSRNDQKRESHRPQLPRGSRDKTTGAVEAWNHRRI